MTDPNFDPGGLWLDGLLAGLAIIILATELLLSLGGVAHLF